MSNESSHMIVKDYSQSEKSEASLLAKDLVVAQALENEDVITDALLDCKTFYGDNCRSEAFLDCLKDVIIE